MAVIGTCWHGLLLEVMLCWVSDVTAAEGFTFVAQHPASPLTWARL